MEDLKTLWATTARRPVRYILRPLWTPAHSEYLRFARESSADPGVLLRALLGSAAVTEPAPLADAPAHQYSEVWQVDRSVRQFLWGLVRTIRPERVLETGVADGASTRTILDAMETNGRGKLYGVDIASDVGQLARQSSGAHRWELAVLPRRGRGKALRSLLDRVQPLDVFLHDSDHSYPWQRFEYREAWRTLAPGGWLLSDDVNGSYAFMDFSRAVGRPLSILTTPRKLFGVMGKGP